MMWLLLTAIALWVLLSFPGAVLVGRAIKGPSDSRPPRSGRLILRQRG